MARKRKQMPSRRDYARVVLSPTNKPTDERQRRAEKILPPEMDGVLRPWWTVRDRLDGLYCAEAIELDIYERACSVRHRLGAHLQIREQSDGPSRVKHQPHSTDSCQRSD